METIIPIAIVLIIIGACCHHHRNKRKLTHNSEGYIAAPVGHIEASVLPMHTPPIHAPPIHIPPIHNAPIYPD